MRVRRLGPLAAYLAVAAALGAALVAGPAAVAYAAPQGAEVQPAQSNWT